MKQLLRGVVAVVLGYAVMVVLITLVQETLFGGVGLAESSRPELAAAGLLTSLSAVVGGVVAGWAAGRRELLHAGVMCALVAIETTALTVQGELDGPLWFDLVAAGSLMVGIALGAWVVARRRAAAAAATA